MNITNSIETVFYKFKTLIECLKGNYKYLC